MQTGYRRATGTSDHLPFQASKLIALTGELRSCLEGYGYLNVDTPAIEDQDLFLIQRGPRVARRLLRFEHSGRYMCFRPEFTASIGRLYVEQMQDWPKPIRVQFSGPVFRREAIGRGRTRQFSMSGAELIGPSGVVADAEVIGVAWESVCRAGVADPTLTLGQMEILGAVLDHFDLDARSRLFLLSILEDTLAADDGPELAAKLMDEFYPRVSSDARMHDITSGVYKSFVLSLLGDKIKPIGSSRTPEEILEGIVRKEQRSNMRLRVEQAFSIVHALGKITGSPDTVIPQLGEQFNQNGIRADCLDSLVSLTNTLGDFGVPRRAIRLNLGLCRGVHYQTGMLFEIHETPRTSSSQICGGGRHDSLFRDLGSTESIPAAGFAIGLERASASALRNHPLSLSSVRVLDVLVVPVSVNELEYAYRIAKQIRDDLGVKVAVEIVGSRSLKSAIGYADKQLVPVVVLAGEEERALSTASVRFMTTREQVAVELHMLTAVIKGKL